MSELTKEHFEKLLSSLATKEDLGRLATRKELEVLASRKDLEAESRNLRAYVEGAFESQQKYLEARFDEIRDELDIQSRFQNLEKRIERLESTARN